VSDRFGDWMQTYNGRPFWPLDARPEDINIQDVAHALANTCRYGGHCLSYYSVAQHSVLVSRVCQPENALWGLLHDAPEAYLGDIPRPLKYGPGFTVYREAEDRLTAVVAEKFGLAMPIPADVHWADEALLWTEKRDILAPIQAGYEWQASNVTALPGIRVTPMAAADAKHLFLERFTELTGSRPAFRPGMTLGQRLGA
jgi:5'-deoxynucleotidase YfbR-like HD superfamily hydrolase